MIELLASLVIGEYGMRPNTYGLVNLVAEGRGPSIGAEFVNLGPAACVVQLARVDQASGAVTLGRPVTLQPGIPFRPKRLVQAYQLTSSAYGDSHVKVRLP